jgi:hypothetical protein
VPAAWDICPTRFVNRIQQRKLIRAYFKLQYPIILMSDLARGASGGESLSHIVTAALSRYLNKPVHTLFQISTSRALVAGIYSGAVSSGLICNMAISD